MTDSLRCRICGQEWMSESSDHCPKCLLAVGIEPSQAQSPEEITVDANQTLSHDGPTAGSSIKYFGDYVLLEEIARGGMGVVYRARQSSLNRIVALKMILSGQLASDDDIQRFHREAESAASLQHPNIVAIHEVGEYGGQHYFSMDFVEGSSLAEFMRSQPFSHQRSAELVTKIAKAVECAHENGTLHRDLKPANILMDQEGEPHITDFGLAKQIQTDSGITHTGQALGTPSYMPPEQAAGQLDLIAPTSDVYALGAILYELLTGRAPFRAETTFDTILQVIEGQPPFPRLLNPRIPKDLETICLKCLQKEPTRRYPSARAMAEDLERFTQGEPIEARPIGVAERSWRWLRKQRRSVVLGAVAVVLTSVLGVLGTAAWIWFTNWQLGYVSIRSDKPPIIAEILDNKDHPVEPKFTLPTADPIALPQGEYRFRFSAPGRMSRTYHTSISRSRPTGELELKLNLEDQILWPSKSIDRTFDLVHLEHSADLVVIDDAGLQLFHGSDVRYPKWNLNIVKPVHDPLREMAKIPNAIKNVNGLRWPWSHTDRGYIGPGKTTWKPKIVGGIQSEQETNRQQPPDLDADGVQDIVLAAQHQAWLLAVSGKTGKVIWFAGRGSDLEGKSDKSDQSRHPVDQISSAVLGTPQVVDDQNGDRVPDLVTTFANLKPDSKTQPNHPRYWVELVSGINGESIWRFDIDPSWLEVAAGTEIPNVHKWFTSWAGYGQNGGGWTWNREMMIRDRRTVYMAGSSHNAPLPARVNRIGNRNVLMIAGTRLIVIDFTTGDMIQSTDLGFFVHQPPHFSDVERDGHADLVLVEKQQSSDRGRVSPKARVIVFDLSESRKRWEYTCLVEPFEPPFWSMTDANWPLVEDLDSDGHQELIVPTDSSIGKRGGGFGVPSPWAAISVLDAITGQVKWTQQIATMDQQLDHLIAGPDIDGDDVRDIFVASLVNRNYDLYVDALSGKSGKKLWWVKRRMGTAAWLNGIHVWPATVDGWPQILVGTISELSDEPAKVFSFASATGRFLGVGEDLRNICFADGNGDQTPDLFAIRPRKMMNLDFGGTLHALKGPSGELWRRLGGDWETGNDYDGDGCKDCLVRIRSGASVKLNPPPLLVGVSSRTGKQIWTTRLQTANTNYIRPIHSDLNGDGTPDLLATHASTGGYYTVAARQKFPLEAISGRDGKRIWTAKITAKAIRGTTYIRSINLRQNEQHDVVFAGSLEWLTSNKTFGLDNWLAVISGRTGKVRWRHRLTEKQTVMRIDSFRPSYADANRDGVLDIVVPAESDNGSEIRVIDGVDGSTIWSRPLQNVPSYPNCPTPICVDLESDGLTEILFLEYFYKPTGHDDAQQRFARLVALGRDGKEKWKWETEVHEDCGKTKHTDRRHTNRPIPIAINSKNRTECICLGLWGRPGKVVLIDHTGKLLASLPVQTQMDDFRPYISDLDADGADEILIHAKNNVLTLRTDSNLSEMWHWPLPSRPDQRFIQITNASETDSPIVILQDKNTVLGLSGKDGKVQWTCQGTIHRNAEGLPTVAKNVRILPTRMKATKKNTSTFSTSAPLIAFHLSNDVTVCQHPSNLNHHMNPIRSISLSKGQVKDARLLRPSPFGIPDHEKEQVYATITWGVFLAATMVMFPIWFSSQLFRHRSWTLRRFLLIPLVIGILLVIAQLPAPPAVIESSRFHSTLYRIAIGVVFCPVFVFPGFIFRMLKQKRWKTTIAIVSSALLIGMIPLCVLKILGTKTLGPGERFAWDSLHVPLLAGCYVIGCVLTLVIFIKGIFNSLRRRSAVAQ